MAHPLLVGWAEDDLLVGCVGAERSGDREFRLRELFVNEGFRGPGIGTALVEAIVGGAPSSA